MMFWVQMGPESKIEEVTVYVSKNFKKKLYQGLVIGELISVVAHFKLALFQL